MRVISDFKDDLYLVAAREFTGNRGEVAPFSNPTILPKGFDGVFGAESDAGDATGRWRRNLSMAWSSATQTLLNMRRPFCGEQCGGGCEHPLRYGLCGYAV